MRRTVILGLIDSIDLVGSARLGEVGGVGLEEAESTCGGRKNVGKRVSWSLKVEKSSFNRLTSKHQVSGVSEGSSSDELISDDALQVSIVGVRSERGGSGLRRKGREVSLDASFKSKEKTEGTDVGDPRGDDHTSLVALSLSGLEDSSDRAEGTVKQKDELSKRRVGKSRQTHTASSSTPIPPL